MDRGPRTATPPGATDEGSTGVRRAGDGGLFDDAGAPDEQPLDTRTEPAPPSLAATFASAIGASMLGLEQALRSQPPAQVTAWEHRPVRGSTASDGGISLEFPDDGEPRDEDATGGPTSR